MNTAMIKDALDEMRTQTLFSLEKALATQNEHASDTDCSRLIEQFAQHKSPEIRTLINVLKRIDAARCQLELGLYGLCSDCEEEIDAARLNADPCQQRCVHCEKKYQSQLRHQQFAL